MAWTIENTSATRGLESDVSREREVPPGGGFADLLAREEAPRIADERRPVATRDERDDVRDDVRRSDEARPAKRDEDVVAPVARRDEGAAARPATDDAPREARPAVTKARTDRRAATPAKPQQAGADTEVPVTPAVKPETHGTGVAVSETTTTSGTGTAASAAPVVLPLFAAAVVAPTTAGGAKTSTSTSTSTKSATTVTTTASTATAAATPVLAAAMAPLAGTGGTATPGPPSTPTGATGTTPGTTAAKPTHSTPAAALSAAFLQPADAWLRTLALASGQGQTATDGDDGEPAGHPAERAVAAIGLDPAVLEGGGRAAPTTDSGAAVAKAAEPTPQGPSRALCEALGQLATRFDDLPPGASRVAQMTVRLTPEGFGSVELGVRMQAGVVHVVVRCESERTARALRAETGALRRAFAGTKLELDGVDIETMAGGTGRSTTAAIEDSAGAEGLV